MYVLGQCGRSLSLKLHVCLRSMWTPDVVFKNQVSIDGDEDAIKNESDAIVEILILDCFEETELCEELMKKKIRFRRTISLGVNCPGMQFDDFPFDTQNCDFILQDLKLTENTDFQCTAV